MNEWAFVIILSMSITINVNCGQSYKVAVMYWLQKCLLVIYEWCDQMLKQKVTQFFQKLSKK